MNASLKVYALESKFFSSFMNEKYEHLQYLWCKEKLDESKSFNQDLLHYFMYISLVFQLLKNCFNQIIYKIGLWLKISAITKRFIRRKLGYLIEEITNAKYFQNTWILIIFTLEPQTLQGMKVFNYMINLVCTPPVCVSFLSGLRLGCFCTLHFDLTIVGNLKM